ncbi:efflux RND transporter periplasmic adaptor subunit [Glaciecola sp. 1036]|uniref:efflux RND transporter periplasmic adaptor subunit n=1 Tax=Alteromonadaceae TaxID=72275 RepID=UPI003D03E267
MKKVGIPIIILVVSIVILMALVITKPKPEKKEPKIDEFLVEASPVVFDNIDFLVYAQGSVQPKNSTMLSAQVSGQVIAIADDFIEGGFFKKGDVLVELESADYRTDLLLAEAELARAQAALDEEVARGQVAEKEWRSVNTGVVPELGLRKPQLAREKANLQAAQAQLQRAKRNLERTRIRAPYDGLVKSRNIDLGQFVPTGGQIGEIFSTDVAEIRLPLTDSDVSFIGTIDDRTPSVTLKANVAGETRYWQGKLIRDEAVLDESRRVIYGVVEVQDPYNLAGNAHAIPLNFGRFVSADISGISVDNVVKLPRYVARLDGTILTVDEENKIHINEVDVVRTDEDFVYISGGLKANHQVIMSAVSSPYNGMPVRVLEEKEPEITPENAISEDSI